MQEAGNQVSGEPTLRRDPRRVRRYSVGLLAVVVVAVVALVAAGQPLPPAGPFLLLVVAVAFCINRFALFPIEIAATAEAAVLLCAVVGFRDDAAYTGPLLLALLVGPLDMLHWEQRSFVRMAYNAGNRGISVLGATSAFALVAQAGGDIPASRVVGAVVAALVFTAVDSGSSVVLVCLQGGRIEPAVREVLDIDALTLPLAVLGAAVGFLAVAVGWWAVVAPLTALAFVPELLLARARMPGPLVRNVALGVELVGGLFAMSFVAPVPSATALAVLVALAVLAGAELSVDAKCALPPMLAVAVVAAVVVIGDDSSFFAAALVAAVGTATSWWCSDAAAHPSMWRAVPVAVAAGLLAATVWSAAPASGAVVATFGVGAAVVFEVVVVLVGGRSRSAAMEATVWTAPLVAVGVALTLAGRTDELLEGALFEIGIVAAMLVAAWWGSPPWRSRVIVRWARRLPHRGHRVVLLSVCAAAAASGAAAVAVSNGEARQLCVWLAVALGEAAAGMALVGVRQWRFIPHLRRRDAAGVLLGAAGLVTAYPATALGGSAWSLVVLAGSLAVPTAVGRVPVLRERESSSCDIRERGT